MHDRRRPPLAALTLVALFALACSRDGGDPPLKPARPPPHVAAVISLPSLRDGLAGPGAFLDQLQPGFGTQMQEVAHTYLGDLVGAGPLHGFDVARPVHLVVLDEPGHPPQAVAIVAVLDRAELVESTRGLGLRVHRGWAAIGARPAVEAVAPWALNDLVARPAPRLPTARLHPTVILAAHRDGMAGAMRQLLSGFEAVPDPTLALLLRGVVEGAIGAFGEADRIVLTVDASASSVELHAAISPRAGTSLAAFTAAQRPSTFSLLAALPRSASGVYVAGRAAAGALRPRLIEQLSSLLAAVAGRPLDDAGRATVAALLDATTGEMAIVTGTTVSARHITALVGVSDRAAVSALLERRAAALGAPPPETVAGVPFYVDAAADTAVGVWDGVVGLTVGQGARDVASQLVAGSRTDPRIRALIPRHAHLVDDAQARGDSLVQIIELDPAAAALGDGMWITLGAAAEILHLRVSLTSGAVVSAMKTAAALSGGAAARTPP